MIVDDVKYRKIVSVSDLVVVYIVCRSNLKASCTEIHSYIAVLDDRNLLVDQRDKDLLTPEPVITLVVRVYTYCSIGHDCLRTGRSHDDVFVCRISVSVRNEISEVIELADCILMHNLFVTYSCKTNRVPVHHTYSPVDISLFIEIYECIDHGLAQIRIHSELCPVPVA